MTKEIFLKKIEEKFGKEIKYVTEKTEKGTIKYFAYLEEFSNILGASNPSQKAAKEDLLLGLWETYSFLRNNRGRLGVGPKEDLKHFEECLS